jgi:putative component of membrane protein insertase Oxa1/YidC/SpoIIIJ protein YidD/RNase P protein component
LSLLADRVAAVLQSAINAKVHTTSRAFGVSLKRMNFHPFFVCALRKKRALCAVHPSQSIAACAAGRRGGQAFAPRAATRNTIKRVTRELFRNSALPPSIAWCACRAPSTARMALPPRPLKAELRVELAVCSRRKSPPRPVLLLRHHLRAMKTLLLLLRLSAAISPMLGQNCRFYPSCSNYALEALRAWRRQGQPAGRQAHVPLPPVECGGVDPVPPADCKQSSTTACGCNHS